MKLFAPCSPGFCAGGALRAPRRRDRCRPAQRAEGIGDVHRSHRHRARNRAGRRFSPRGERAARCRVAGLPRGDRRGRGRALLAARRRRRSGAAARGARFRDLRRGSQRRLDDRNAVGAPAARRRPARFAESSRRSPRRSGSRSHRARPRSWKPTSIACRWAETSTASRPRRAPTSASPRAISISRRRRCSRRFQTIPPRLAPDADWTALRARQRFVLATHGRSSARSRAARADRAFAETLAVRRHDSGIADAAHALFFLYRQLRRPRGRVRTTIDRSLQRFVQAQTQDVDRARCTRYHVTDGAALVVDNRTGDVLAYVGSPDYFSDEALGTQRRRAGAAPAGLVAQAVHLRARARARYDPLRRRFLPTCRRRMRFPAASSISPAITAGASADRCACATRWRTRSTRRRCRCSRGSASERLLDRLHDLGFAHLDHPASYYGLGLTLGSGEVSLWELVQAYATIARGGSVRAARISSPTRRVARDSDRRDRRLGAGHRHARRPARAREVVRRRLGAADAVPRGGEDRHVVGFSRHVDGRLHARLHGRRVGRQLRRQRRCAASRA